MRTAGGDVARDGTLRVHFEVESMPRVLIAAPADLVARLDGSILKRSGVERVVALHPEHAFEAIRSSRPDLVILGEIDGNDTRALLRRIRTDTATRNVQMAVITAAPASP